MKHTHTLTLTLTLLLFSFTCFAQVNVEMGFGLQQTAATKLNRAQLQPQFKLAVGAQVGKIVMEIAERPAITRCANAAAWLGGSVGINLRGLIPSVGYYYEMKYQDDKSQNAWHPGVNLRYIYFVNRFAGLYAEASFINNQTGITAGIHYEF